jgi:hypothetical protein
MNNVYTVPFAPVEAVQQVKSSDAALNSVIIPRNKTCKIPFSYFLYIKRMSSYYKSSSHGQLRSNCALHQQEVC